MKNILFLLLLLFILTATAEPMRTVDWYRKHQTDRTALLKNCRNNPGELSATPNCKNAEKADAIEKTARTGRLHIPTMTKQQWRAFFDRQSGR